MVHKPVNICIYIHVTWRGSHRVCELCCNSCGGTSSKADPGGTHSGYATVIPPCSMIPWSTEWFDLIDLLCLTPLSAIFQLYHGDQF